MAKHQFKSAPEPEPEETTKPIKTPFIEADDLPVVEPTKPPATVIHLLHDYGGRRTKEQRIPPGLYKVDDPQLMGLADYLVANGHAVRD